MECLRCGTCCVAPDIAGLDKPLGVRCPHLTAEHTCGIWEKRPDICRAYSPDEVCHAVQAPTLESRAARYLDLFGLADEARRVRDAGFMSMVAARRHERS